jgi:hypothetical protein
MERCPPSPWNGVRHRVEYASHDDAIELFNALLAIAEQN